MANARSKMKDNKIGIIDKNATLRTPYKRFGDCCYGCPYPICPSRPARPLVMERPDCVWSLYNKKTKH